jgi:hypothetical protein
MRRLDDVVGAWYAGHPEAAARRPGILKLDVQGYELEVLKGACDTLKSVDVVVLETSVLPYNADTPLTGDVVAAMHALGFNVLAVLEMHYTGERDDLLFQVDFAFVRKDSRLYDAATADAGLKQNR